MPWALGIISTFEKISLNASEDGTKEREPNLILSQGGSQHHLVLWALERETDFPHVDCAGSSAMLKSFDKHSVVVKWMSYG